MAETPAKVIGKPNLGDKFEYSLNGTAWVDVDNLISQDFPKVQRGLVPASTRTQTNRFKRKRKGWQDSQALTIKAALTAAAVAALYTIFIDDASDDLFLRQTPPQAYDASASGTWTYRGIMSNFDAGSGVETEKDELIEIVFEVTPTTIPVYTPPT